MTPRYRVVVDAPARRGIHRLPAPAALAVATFIAEVLPHDAMRVSKPLTGELTGLRSARRGDYRVLLEIDEDERTVHVVRVAHRRDVYRPGS